MATPKVNLTEVEVKERVVKDSTERLAAELLIVYPNSLNAAKISEFSRDELIKRITRGRLFLGILTRIPESLEEKFPFVVEVKPVGEPEVSEMSVDQLLKYFLMRDERRDKEEALRREEQRRKEARQDQIRKEEWERADRLHREEREERERERREMEARHRTSLDRDNKKELRVKRASDVLSKTVGIFPEDPLSIPTFFHLLERQFVLNAIDEDLFLPLLNQLLTDKARRLVARLSDDEAASYAVLKQALLREFQLTPSKYRENFVNTVKNREETFVNLATRLEVGLKYYLESRKIKLNDENRPLFNLLIADRLKECVPDYLMDFVRDKELDNWLQPQKLAELLDTFVADKQVGGNQSHNGGNVNENFGRNNYSNGNRLVRKSQIRCTRCFGYGHARSQCTRPFVNQRGQGNGFGAKQPAGQSVFKPFGASNESKIMRCNLCRGPHYARNCTANKSVYGTNRVVRFHSNESLHIDKLTEEDTELKQRVDHVGVLPQSEIVSEEIKPNVEMFSDNVGSKHEFCRKVVDLNVVINLGESNVSAVVDSGAQITTVHKDLVPIEYLNDGSSRGKITLQGAFGNPVTAELIILPCKLIQNVDSALMSTNISTTLISCAVTDQLSEVKVLLSLADYHDLLKIATVILPVIDLNLMPNYDCSIFNPHLDDDQVTATSPVALTDSNNLVGLPHIVPINTDNEVVYDEVDVDLDVKPIVSCNNNEECSKNMNVMQICDENIGNVNMSSEFLMLQKNDLTLENCFKQAEQKKGPYFVHPDSKLLYRRITVKNINRDQLVVPEVKRREILFNAHENNGHFGVKKVKQSIAKVFYWPTLKRDCIDYVSRCPDCQKRRRLTVFDRVPIRPVVKPTTCFEVISIDICGPINPPSARGHHYVLGMICLQSRWVEVYPLKTLKSSEICDNIVKFCQYAGIPKCIISDNAASMTSSLNEELYSRLGIEMRTSTQYHSEGNANIERFFLTFQSMLHHCIVSEKPREWDKCIPNLLWVYRNMPNETTGLTPYFLVFGKEGRGVLDVLKDTWSGDINYPPTLNSSTVKYLETLKENLRIAQESAEIHAGKMQTAYIDKYNKRTKDKSFSVGDQVLILMPDSTNKLKSRWIGPSVITQKLSKYSYMVASENGSVRALHANKLREFKPRIESIGIVHSEDFEFGDIVECPLSTDHVDDVDFDCQLDKLDLSHLSSEQKNRVITLLKLHRKAFSDKPGKCDRDIAQHTIRLLDGFQPKAMRPYRIPEKLQVEVSKQIDDFLKQGLIRESNSEYGHPIVCVTKPCGDIRLCCDMRYVNSGTISDRYPLPRVDDLIRKVSSAKFITSLDCTQGYYQIPMNSASISLTSFVTHKGQYEWLYMPFGLKCASQTFQRALDRILAKHDDYARAYIDDICCHTSSTFDDHLHQLDCVLKSIEDAGLTLKLSKCKFAKPSVLFVGHVVGNGTIVPNPDRVVAIRNIVEPTTKKAVRSFLAMCNYYRSHIPRFSELAIPLTEITKVRHSSTFVLNDKQREAFNKLKHSLADTTVLYSPKYDRKFILYCDASEYAAGACLSQLNDNGVERPIAFASCKFNETQKRWATIERESFAVIFGLRSFDVLIFGSEIDVFTDHNPLSYLVNCSPRSAKLTRWALGIQRWNINVKHRSGKLNVNADCLSRL